MNGLIPLTWKEINAWRESTGIYDHWLAKSIKILSTIYVDEFDLSRDPGKVSPIHDQADVDEQRKVVANQFKKFFKG